jgi:uncharacterized membrane protein YeaQ/YmgE (transglycosylase-associated protein family)
MSRRHDTAAKRGRHSPAKSTIKAAGALGGRTTPEGEAQMGLIAWIIVGAIAGFIANQIMSTGQSLLMTVVLGIVGGLVGGFIASAMNLGSVTGINIESILIATIGAVLVLVVAGFVQRRSPG